MKTLKEELLAEIIWITARNGGLQRSYLYSKNATQSNRISFRKFLHCHLSSELLDEFSGRSITEQELVEKIKDIKEKAERKFSSILDKETMTFGQAQKLVNIYLKSMWVTGLLTEPPPHFPVDRKIQKIMKRESIDNWTTVSEDTYLEIIDEAKPLAQAQGCSLAEWEARAFLELKA